MSAPTALITGGASGLGLAMARRLARSGWRLVLVGRDASRLAAAADALHSPDPAAERVRWYAADLERRHRIHDLAGHLHDAGIAVDVLLNNAGAAFARYTETGDGAERTHALNHHAPFLLTHALLASAALTPRARIVNLSTFVEKRGRLDPSDPDVAGTSWRRRFYSQIHVYATSKLLSLLATRELARRLPAGMRAYSADPGMIRGTAINRSAGGLMRLTAPLLRPWSATVEQGVQTPLLLAAAHTPAEPSGGFFSGSRPASPSALARDDALAREVYERTARLLGTAALS